MLQFLRKSSSHRRVESLIRQGVGVSEASWRVPGGGDASESEHVVDSIVHWVRKAMGEMRRPNGIDHVALALACRTADGTVLCSNSLGVIRPASFYSPEGAARIAAFLGDVEAVRHRGGTEIAGALLSLGDLAFELDQARAA
jgi:hypothetical protein